MSRAGTENTALDVGDIPEIPEGERAITPPYSAGVEPTQPRARTSERTAHAGPALVADGAAMRAETVCSTEPVTGDEGPFSVLTPSLGVESLTDRQLVNLPVGTRVRVFRQLTEEAKQLCLACSHPLAIPLAYQALSQGYVLVSHAGQLFRLPAWEVSRLA